MLSHPVYIERATASFQSAENGFVFAEPDYKVWIKNANMRRRMSRMVRMGVATGMECLDGITEPIDAILTATGYGCLTDTEIFMNSFLDTDEQQPSPSSFIQSTFNTIGAQLAILTDNHQYNNTYVHRGFSFESALADAISLLAEGDARKVLAGATDEMTPTLNTLLGRMGNWKHYAPGEGAAFFLLSSTPPEQTPAIIIQDIEMITGDYTKEELQHLADNFIAKHGIQTAKFISPDSYKCFCGEYPTSTSFALWMACKAPELFKTGLPIVICNSFLKNHSFILLRSTL
ncbi:beta-ketoacyl synthase chain length factor [Massilibacteroides vaginae]|uniref:beta-ketoacyl synthase chain length factor n=1 Tax=Massilibacteroides vaginae TaxID=1673718 RepID=UPI000A1CBBD7|nr:beta-ketoacyl synthase chain length factor [Massilibacteroides vaginae]